MIKPISAVFGASLLTVSVYSAAAAELVIKQAKIYTQNEAQPWASAMAVQDGRIVYVGDDRGADKYIGPNSETLVLNKQLILPGLVDAHVHPGLGAVKDLYECNFPFSAGPAEVAATVAECYKNTGADEWIRGGQWSSNFFVDNQIASPRKFLDKVSPDKPVALVDDSYHNAWFNTLGLAKLGIDGSHIDGVEIEMGADGKPNGVVVEAFGLIQQRMPWKPEQYKAAAAYVVKTANRFGITGIKGTSMPAAEAEGFRQQEQQGKLSLHVAMAQATPYGHRHKPLDVAVYDKIRQSFKDSAIDANFIKIFMDGVPTAARTAAMLAPYTVVAGQQATRGALHIPADLLTRDVVALDKAGYTIKIHTAGDRSVRVALDAIEAARKANGDSGLRHELAHAGYVDAADMPRFKQLNAVADLCPYIWSPSPIIDSVIAAVGNPRAERYWPIKDLVESGAPVLAGSDWPAAVASMNPWPGLESMVTRADPTGQFPGTLWAEQAVSLEQA
ncbi:MAG: amidohydrolase, partial [Cellvibrionaceae bacterium]|nr:amidohydrolase [Cellvibrionaceae bacterium]